MLYVRTWAASCPKAASHATTHAPITWALQGLLAVCPNSVPSVTRHPALFTMPPQAFLGRSDAIMSALQEQVQHQAGAHTVLAALLRSTYTALADEGRALAGRELHAHARVLPLLLRLYFACDGRAEVSEVVTRMWRCNATALHSIGFGASCVFAALWMWGPQHVHGVQQVHEDGHWGSL